MTDESDAEESEGLFYAIKELVLKPLHYATSKQAWRAYINTIILVSTGIVMLGVAASSYFIFYYSYIPIRGFTEPIHFQFDRGQNPYAVVPLRSGYLVSNQPYDVKIQLHLPRTPSNTAAGNFMLELELVPPHGKGEDGQGVTKERRPAIMTYYSPMIDLVHKTVGLPLYVVGWWKESERISVPLMGGIEFARGWRNIPTKAVVGLISPAHLQVYSADLEFKARLRGLRYLMYNYRMVSFFVFTTMFWFMAMTTTVFIWFIFAQGLSRKGDAGPVVKKELDEATAGALKGEFAPYDAEAKVKTEEAEDSLLYDYQPAIEADDEDEEESMHGVMISGQALGPSDSGIGTSLESGSSKPTARRRTSRTLSGE